MGVGARRGVRASGQMRLVPVRMTTAVAVGSGLNESALIVEVFVKKCHVSLNGCCAQLTGRNEEGHLQGDASGPRGFSKLERGSGN
jgi:hypothetical protein